MNEEALLLGPYRSLVGVYTHALKSAAGRDPELAVVMFNAGLIHHVGPHRLHVKLARALAAQGVSATRVDMSAIGDSSVRPDSMPKDELERVEPGEIMDDLERHGHTRFVLLGICSGAKIALQAAAADPRVVGAVLVNPALADEERNAVAFSHHYVSHSARNPRAWRNLLTGRVNYARLVSTLLKTAWRKLRRRVSATGSMAAVVRAELMPALERNARLLMLLSDRHARFARLLGDEIADLGADGRLSIEVHSDADHLYSLLADQELVVATVCRWLQSFPVESAETTDFSRVVGPPDGMSVALVREPRR